MRLAIVSSGSLAMLSSNARESAWRGYPAVPSGANGIRRRQAAHSAHRCHVNAPVELWNAIV